MMTPTSARSGYTLLEILLALALMVLLLGGLYMAAGTQFQVASTGRNLVERTTLSRAVFSRMSTDIAAATTLVDPGRYRRNVSQATGAAYNSGAAEPTGSTGTGTTGTGTTGTGTTGTGTTGTGTTGTGMAPASGSTGSTGSTSSTTPPTPTTEDTTGTGGSISLTGPVRLPIGVVGDGSTLHLIITRLPKETWRIPAPSRWADLQVGVRPEDGTQLVSDLRVVSYWLAGDASQPLGLGRHEQKIITTEEALNLSVPDSEAQQRFVIAPEVKGLAFEYFDGSAWTSSWDSNQPGEDGMTPMGPPRAIRITIEVDFSETMVGAARDTVQLKTFRHVVAINTANGAPMIMLEDPENGTQPEQGGTTDSSSTGTTGSSSGGSTTPTTPTTPMGGTSR